MLLKETYNELDIALMSEEEALELVRCMIQAHPYDTHPEADKVAAMVAKLKPGVRAILRKSWPSFQDNSLVKQLGTMLGMTCVRTGQDLWVFTWAEELDTKPT